MTIDKFLIFVLLGNLILKDYFDKEWTVWLWGSSVCFTSAGCNFQVFVGGTG